MLVDASVGALALPAYSIVITFDDGFRDFGQIACPALTKLGFDAIVYLPSDNVGREESWDGAHKPPRQLMSWHEVEQLHSTGTFFGSHTVSHPNLNSLQADALVAELEKSQQDIARRLGPTPVHFAPPYGMANKAVRTEIAKRYRTSVGTRLGSASPSGDLMDLPRIEMYYFADQTRWRTHLARKGAAYLQMRKMARKVRKAALNPWQ